jgi:hypothetical protein
MLFLLISLMEVQAFEIIPSIYDVKFFGMKIAVTN